ncbi:MAG: protein translocase subunit SecD [Acidimicrobiales bacterium]|jgi:preprotein translocase subunit SecD|nr:protein translocase subunit SecD [Acidimicrobiales bacterium]HJL98120.1 protein translocase subunit SecD [Acidimicrobiales bacterium]
MVLLIVGASLAGVLSAGWTPVLGVQLQGGVEVVLRPADEVSDEQFERAIEIIRNRIDAIGVAEPDITRQGDQVVIQLPGVKDKQRAVDLIGKTAELTFRPVITFFDPFDPNQRAAAKQVVEGSAVAEDENVDGDTEPTVSLSDLLTPPDQDDAAATVAVLGSTGQTGFVLAPAQLTGEVIEEAVATFQGQWIVNLSFNEEGALLFDQMAVANYERQVAIVLDGVVESAPTINATEFKGQAVISGSFDEAEAKNLALVLRFGALPVEFERDDVRTVSATLGEGTLRAGVIAGLVGLALVGLYMLLYYRLLGFVAICSLAVSGATLWSIIAWLGESKGLALTLAGATGIIVSIGVQVDSNIVYYERIKEEVRRGRAVRSAADGSFRAAFSTIIWADLASLIGAGVLYQLTSGTVRGFALYLGITTLIDLAVSFFFMRPLVVFVARRLVNERPKRLGLTTITEEASV